MSKVDIDKLVVSLFKSESLDFHGREIIIKMLKEQGLQYFDGEITYIDDDGIEKIKTIDYEENVQLTDFEIFLQNLFDVYANYKGRLKNSYIKMLRKRLTDYLNEEEHIKEK